MNKSIDLGIEISKIHPIVMREVTKKQMTIFSKGFLTVPQVAILDLLDENGQCRMSELAKALGFTMSAVTAIIDKMIGLKLVKRERSSQDRRVVKVLMLEKGRETAGRIRKERINIANDLLSSLNKKDKEEYLRLSRKIYDHLIKKQNQSGIAH